MLEQLNIQMFIAINQFAGSSAALDGLMIGAAKYMPLVFVLSLLFLWIYKGKQGREATLYSSYSAAVGIALDLLIGLAYFHPRPFMMHLGHALMRHAAENSFPSDHTTGMLSIAIVLVYFKETRKLGAALAVLGLFGGIARVYCGIHFPFDIVGSIAVAAIASLSVLAYRDRLGKLNGRVLKAWGKLVPGGN